MLPHLQGRHFEERLDSVPKEGIGSICKLADINNQEIELM